MPDAFVSLDEELYFISWIPIRHIKIMKSI